MKLVNDKTLDFARGPGYCDWCQKPVNNRNPHHVFSKGSGGPDIRCNIAALCATFAGGLNCHHAAHYGEIDDNAILATVAAREGCQPNDIRSLVMLVRRMPRITEVSKRKFMEICTRELVDGAWGLAMRELPSFEHLLAEEL